MTTPDVHLDAAYRLWRAEIDRAPVPPLGETHADLTVRDAYSIQQIGRGLRLLQGATPVGRKIGLTSRAMQDMLNVHEPDFGFLLDAMKIDGGTASMKTLIAPRAEAEIAFILETDLSGPAVTADDALAATASIAPAIEIIDSRIADWRITLIDTIADNASSALFALGAERSPERLDLSWLEGVVRVDQAVEKGRGSAVLGHPAEAVAWLANKLAEFGNQLKAGEIVLSGAVSRALPIASGSIVSAEFESLGSVAVTFA